MGKTARNEITHDKIKTKPQNDKYATGWERIFGKKEDGNKDDNDNNEQRDRDSGSGCGS
jgi:hypothetical protein